jgi:hypothetical protein
MVNLHSIVPVSAKDMQKQDLFVLDAFPVPTYSIYMLEVEVTDKSLPLKVTIVSDHTYNAHAHFQLMHCE